MLDPLGSDSHPSGPSPAPFLPGSLPGSKPCVHRAFASARPGCAGKHVSEADPVSGPQDGMRSHQQYHQRIAVGGSAPSGWLAQAALPAPYQILTLQSPTAISMGFHPLPYRPAPCSEASHPLAPSRVSPVWWLSVDFPCRETSPPLPRISRDALVAGTQGGPLPRCPFEDGQPGMDVAELVLRELGDVSVCPHPEPHLWTSCSGIWGRRPAPSMVLPPAQPRACPWLRLPHQTSPVSGSSSSRYSPPKNPELHSVIKEVLLVKHCSAALYLNTMESHYTPDLWVCKQCTNCTGIAKNIFQVMPRLGSFHSLSSPPLDQNCIKL